MKNCKSIEKKLVAYLHGELNERDFQTLENHLETCESCRAELEAQRTALELLSEALAVAPAPETLVGWNGVPQHVPVRKPAFGGFGHRPWLRPVLVGAAACSVFVMIGLLAIRGTGGSTDRAKLLVKELNVPVSESEPMPAVAQSAVSTEPESGVLTYSAADGDRLSSSASVTLPADQSGVGGTVVMNDKVVAGLSADGRGYAAGQELSAVNGGYAYSDSDGATSLGALVAKQPKVAARKATEKMVKLKLKLPKPMFEGTPRSFYSPSAPSSYPSQKPVEQFNTEQYDRIVDNAFKRVLENPLSTFSIDVDRASYANVRRFLNSNRLPPPDAVRIEEMINYFTYDYPQPQGEDPFAVSMDVAQCPWNAEHQLALIGIQGLEIEKKDLPPNNLTFLLDVSGSMNQPNKLPLLQAAMRLLVGQLRPEDRVSIVVYAGAAGMVLEPTSGKGAILEAINRLRAGGSTAGGAGIKLAYDTARKSFIEEGNNRVILATDGDFNVGVSSDGDLTRLIEEKRETGIFLTVLGFGTGNYKDSKMEKLADKGNGNYAYIDDILEAKKVLIHEMGGTLVTIAKDVKIQIEFNPAQVKAYRLVGYENRMLAKEDFNDDTKDAGELGAGHTVTALYELIPAGSDEGVPGVDPLKYQRTKVKKSTELMTVKLRYKQPDGDTSKLIVHSVDTADFQGERPSGNLGFASSVAEFGMLMRRSDYQGSASYDQVLSRARAYRGTDAEGYRAEFIRLVEKAQLLDTAKSE